MTVDRRDPPLSSDPIVRALVAALREVADRRASDEAERRRNLSAVDTGRGGKAA